MSRSCHRDRSDAGFTLIEVTVAMTVLLIVLVLSGALLFSMRSFAQKQQSLAEPRQTARRAMNYLSYYLRGASDMNMADSTAPMPNALVTYYNLGATTNQATYNNVASASLADVGTDLFTVAKPVPGSMPIKVAGIWDGLTTSTISALYSQGCGDSNDNTTNLAQFNQAVGYDATAGTSPLFLVYDPGGFWQYYQITAAPTCDCSKASAASPTVITMTVTAGGILGINPARDSSPVGLTCSDGNPCYMTGGVQFVTFRVRTVGGTPRLEQLALPGRLFDPAQDNPGTSFTPLLDNVEDLQIAYIYGDGTICNSSQPTRLLSTMDSANYPNGVPNMRAEGVTAATYDAVNVRGVRVSVVARSAQPIAAFLGGAGKGAPAITPPEDSTVAYAPGYYHYRLTSTIMIQNRILGN